MNKPILLVVGVHNVLRACTRQLRKQNRVHTAYSGAQAIEILHLAGGPLTQRIGTVCKPPFTRCQAASSRIR